jgi:hypothetical protein
MLCIIQMFQVGCLSRDLLAIANVYAVEIFVLRTLSAQLFKANTAGNVYLGVWLCRHTYATYQNLSSE